MVGKEPYAADAGGIGFLFPFRYLSCHMKIKSHVYLLGAGQQGKESHQISGLPYILMLTDYKGRAIKMSSDMSNEKYRNLRKNPLPRIGKGFFDFHLSSTNKSNTACQTSVSVPAMILSCWLLATRLKPTTGSWQLKALKP